MISTSHLNNPSVSHPVALACESNRALQRKEEVIPKDKTTLVVAFQRRQKNVLFTYGNSIKVCLFQGIRKCVGKGLISIWYLI